MKKIAAVLFALVVAASFVSAEGQKDKFPNGDVTFVNPNAAGGGNAT